MGERSSFSDWSAILGTWVSIVGAVVGGYFALQTYSEEVDKMEDARVVQTFDLFEMFNTGERLESRARIYEYLRAQAEGDDSIGVASNDVYVFVDFYDALQICVERELCDRELAIRLFQSYAVPVWDGMGDTLIGARTDSDPHFAGGLEWMTQLYYETAASNAPAAPAPEPLPTPEPAADASPATAVPVEASETP